jgi:hypothetical protein
MWTREKIAENHWKKRKKKKKNRRRGALYSRDSDLSFSSVHEVLGFFFEVVCSLSFAFVRQPFIASECVTTAFIITAIFFKSHSIDWFMHSFILFVRSFVRSFVRWLQHQRQLSPPTFSSSLLGSGPYLRGRSLRQASCRRVVACKASGSPKDAYFLCDFSCRTRLVRSFTDASSAETDATVLSICAPTAARRSCGMMGAAAAATAADAAGAAGAAGGCGWPR